MFTKIQGNGIAQKWASTRASRVAAALLVAVFASQYAAAETSKYHGTICKPYYGSHADDFRYYTSGIKNISGNTRWVTCPIDRQDVWYYGSSATSIHAYVYNAGGTLWCEGFVTSSTSGSTVNVASSNTTLTGNRSLYMGLHEQFGNNYSVRCLLPPGSIVRSFYTGEP